MYLQPVIQRHLGENPEEFLGDFPEKNGGFMMVYEALTMFNYQRSGDVLQLIVGL